MRRACPALRDLARGNPAARTLRLLEALARGAVDDFSMALLDGRVEVRVTAMLSRARILELIPHQGTMCLLDEVTAWSERAITCRTRSHLAPDNPLRRDGRAQPVYAASSTGCRRPRCMARCAPAARSRPAIWPPCAPSRSWIERLDDPSFGALEVTAQLELQRHRAA